MTHWLPCRRKDFINRLQSLEFDGPYSGTRHQFMIYKNHRLAIPSNKEFSVPQLKMMINEIEYIIKRSISSDEWNLL
jgi:hypothetical protein